jgi:hypothetical protein
MVGQRRYFGNRASARARKRLKHLEKHWPFACL